MARRPRLQARQPQRLAEINWGNPLTRGLRFAYQPGGAVLSPDAVSGNGVSATTGTITSAVGPRGERCARLSSTPAISWPHLASQDITGDITVLVIGMVTSTAADASAVSKATGNGSSNTSFNFGHNTGGHLLFNRANGSGYRVWASVSAPISANVPFVGVVTHTGTLTTNPQFWLNGVADSSGISNLYSGAGTGATTGNTSPITIGNRADAATPWPGDIYLVLVWDRILSASEIATVSQFPWRIFAAAPKRAFIADAAGGSASTGDVSATQAGNTLSAAATLALQATLSVTQASNTLSASAVLALSGTLTKTQDDNSLSASGTLSSGPYGDLSATQANNTLTSSSALAIQATTTAPQAGNTLSAAGVIAIAAALTQTQAENALTAAGARDILATLTATQVDQTLAATGVHPTGMTDSEKIDLILKILSDKQTLDAGTGTYTLYDTDGMTVLYTAAAWEDVAATQPYRGQGLARLDAMQ